MRAKRQRNRRMVFGDAVTEQGAHYLILRSALRQKRTSAVVPKNIPKSLTLRMLYPAFSHERQEDIGPFG
jgi:hypothetical protein